MCGVHFMAETAKLMSPDKKVLLPDMKAGCSLSSSITGEDVRNLKKQFPGTQKMVKQPLVSVIINCFNGEKYLKEAIDSVINQTYTNYDIYILDGGSTDHSVDIIKKYETHLKYWHSKKDKGQSDAINQGLEMCDGDIIAWINSVDTYLPDTFKLVADYFANNQSCDILYGNFYFTDSVGKILRKVKNFLSISSNLTG